MKNTGKTMTLGLLLLSLSGCTLNPPTNDQTLCTQLKRQLNYYKTTPGTEATWTTTGQKEQFMQQLRAHHCD